MLGAAILAAWAYVILYLPLMWPGEGERDWAAWVSVAFPLFLIAILLVL